MLLKKVILPLLLALLCILFLTSILYIILIFDKEASWSFLFKWLYPLSFAVVLIALSHRKILAQWNESLQLNDFLNLKFILLITVIPVLNMILFQPIARSLYYNLAKVKTIKSIDELNAFEKPAFLEVEDWYVDRMQVIPFNSIKPLGGLNFGKYEIQTLLLVPIFNREDAYKTNAKAWLAFAYKENIKQDQANDAYLEKFLNSSITHFKRMNIGDFTYLEAYPRGENYDLLYEMAKVHNFYKSGFDNIYRGEDVEREVLANYYFKYSLFLFLIIGLPAILLLSILLNYFVKRNRNKHMLD